MPLKEFLGNEKRIILILYILRLLIYGGFVKVKLRKSIHFLSVISLLSSCTTSSVKTADFGYNKEELLRSIASEKSLIPMTNPESGLTYWQEFQEMKSNPLKVKKYAIDRAGDTKETLFATTSSDLFHFLIWMRASPISTFQDIRNNQQNSKTPAGIMKFSPLPKNKFPYKPVEDTIVVTKMDDVLEVLDNPKVFSVRNYTKKMEDSVGPFMMAYDESRYNMKEKPWMRKLLPASDLPRARQLVKKLAYDVLGSQRYVGSDIRGQEFGRLEVVNQYARRVPAMFVQDYFGLKSVSPEKLLEWSRATQDDFFHNLVNDENVKTKAEIAGADFNNYLKSYIKSRSEQLQKEIQSNNLDEKSITSSSYYANLDILSRLILDKEPDVVADSQDQVAARIRTNAMGTLVGAVETTQSAVTQAFHEIQKRPVVLDYARKIAAAAEKAETSGDQQTLDKANEAMERLVWEALRFNPINPIVVRYAETNFTLKNGYQIKKGSHILVATHSAMFDEKYFSEPNKFDPYRDRDAKFIALSKTDSFVKEAVNPNLKRFEQAENHVNSSKWLKFQKSFFQLGYGHHRCLGDYLGEIFVPEMVMLLMKLPNAHAVDGQAGLIDFRYLKETSPLGDKYYYSFPERYSIEFSTQTNLPRIASILKKKEVEVVDQKYAYEAYLQNFDRDLYRRCLAGWDIEKSASELKLKDFAKGIKNANTVHNLNVDMGNKDFLYCRLNQEFQKCMDTEQKLNKFHRLGNENTLSGKGGDISDFDKHLAAFERCNSSLNSTEIAFYNSVFFGKALDMSQLDMSKSKRNNDKYKFEDDLKFYVRFNSRESMLNPLGWKKIPESEKALMYTRLDLDFRLCFGKKVNLLRKAPNKAYNECKDGVYMPKQFIKVGSLSQMERFYMLRDYLKVPGVNSVNSVKEVEARLEVENP